MLGCHVKQDDKPELRHSPKIFFSVSAFMIAHAWGVVPCVRRHMGSPLSKQFKMVEFQMNFLDSHAVVQNHRAILLQVARQRPRS